jgi:hypothetical protein
MHDRTCGLDASDWHDGLHKCAKIRVFALLAEAKTLWF